MRPDAKRYARNKKLIGSDEQALLASKHVLVAGCGGIGGYAIEVLARLGVGHLTVVDGDVFDETNLNRQILATSATMGRSKAQVAEERIGEINPLVAVTTVSERLSRDNAERLLEGVDVAIDALDSPGSRAMLLETAAASGIPAVHASIAGWSIRVAVCPPDGDGVRAIAVQEGAGLEAELGNPSFTAAAAGSIEAAQAAKILLGRSGVEEGVLLEYDLLRNTLDKIEVRAR